MFLRGSATDWEVFSPANVIQVETGGSDKSYCAYCDPGSRVIYAAAPKPWKITRQSDRDVCKFRLTG